MRVGARPLPMAGLVVAGLVLDRVADPVAHDLPLCPFRAVTGLYCPLCGGLRSAYALSRLDLAQAVRDNVLFLAAVPVLLLVWLDWLRRDRAGLPGRRIGRGVLTALWVLAIAFTVTRNLTDGLRPAG